MSKYGIALQSMSYVCEQIKNLVFKSSCISNKFIFLIGD